MSNFLYKNISQEEKFTDKSDTSLVSTALLINLVYMKCFTPHFASDRGYSLYDI